MKISKPLAITLVTGASIAAILAGTIAGTRYNNEQPKQVTQQEYNTFTDSLQTMCDNAFDEISQLDIFPKERIPKPRIHPFTLISNRSHSLEDNIFIDPKTIDEYLTGNPNEKEIFLLYNKFSKTKDKKQLAEANLWYTLFHESTHNIFNALGYNKDIPIYPERIESPAIIYGLEKTWEKGERENKPMYKEFVKRKILDYLFVYNQTNNQNKKVQDLKMGIDFNDEELKEMNSFLEKNKKLKIHKKRFNPNIPFADGLVNGCLERANDKLAYYRYVGRI